MHMTPYDAETQKTSCCKNESKDTEFIYEKIVEIDPETIFEL